MTAVDGGHAAADVLDVPLIDVAAWATGDAPTRAAIAGQVGDAARDIGFMQITGHGIPAPVLAGFQRAIDGFFDLAPADKRAVRAPTPSINRGYTAPGAERLSYSLGVASPADLFEAFNMGSEAAEFPGLALADADYSANIWPPAPPGFEAALRAWYQAVGGVARTMTRVFAVALGLPEGYFASYTDHSIDTLRVNNYRMPAGDVVLEPGQLGMGPHTDFGIVTLLWADPLPGLEILTPEGQWRSVIPAAGALLVNLGDVLARWTNDRWRSTMHRVKVPIDAAGRPFRRRSAAYFHDGNADAVIATIPGCERGDVEAYPPITVAAHIAAKLAGSRTLRLNPGAERDARRLTDPSPFVRGD